MKKSNLEKLQQCLSEDETTELIIALGKVRERFGRFWKNGLVGLWVYGSYISNGLGDYEYILHKARNCEAFDVIVHMTGPDIDSLQKTI